MKWTIAICLALAFVAMKLTGALAWTWPWVLAPLWGNLAFIIVLGGSIDYGKHLVKTWRGRKRS